MDGFKTMEEEELDGDLARGAGAAYASLILPFRPGRVRLRLESW